MRILSIAILGLLAFLSAQAQNPGEEIVIRQDRKRILRLAAEAMKLSPPNIGQARSALSEGSPNEFFSMSDYFWPDPDKADGKPYVMRDGQSNPDNFNQHRAALMAMRDATASLASAYLLTRDERYGEKAVELLKVFFLDPETRMHPSLDHAQAIVGKATPDRGTGLIDTLHLVEVPLAIMTLRGSKSMDPMVYEELLKWFSEYVSWFVTSSKGRNEAKAKNNHAVAYWLQVAAFATFIEDKALLAECRRQFKEVFVPVQMGIDGGFPLELARTKPYAYSIFQLDNMAALCQILSTPADNLWTFRTKEGKGMSRALAYLHPYLADKTSWPLEPDVNAWEGWPVRQPNLLLGGLAFHENKYVKLWRELKPDTESFEIRRNNAITQPLLWVTLFDHSQSIPKPKKIRAKDAFASSARILFEDDFRTGTVARWNISENDRYSLPSAAPERIAVVDAPGLGNGEKAVRFTVKRAPNSFRSEISLPHEEGFQERWYAAKILIPEDWVLDPRKKTSDIVMQWHGIPGNWRPTHPNLAVAVSNDGWFIKQSYGSPQQGPTRTSVRLEEPVKRGVWVSWIVHAKWSPTEEGILQIWRDGKLVLDRKGPNVYGTIGEAYTPYLKTGIYRPEWHMDTAKKLEAFNKEPAILTHKTIYVMDVKIGSQRASLEDFLGSKQP
ncbi:MAG TPA: alginate lyase family protein [Prosthecobacter sp.]